MNAILSPNFAADAVAVALPEPSATRHAGHAVVDRAALAYALAVGKLATEKRNTIPILGNVKMIAVSASVLAVITTNVDIEIRVDVPAAVDVDFGVTMSTHLLESFLKKTTCDMVAIQSFGERDEYRIARNGETGAGENGHVKETRCISGNALLDFQRVKYQAAVLPVIDFPTMEVGAASNSFGMTGALFYKILSNVSGAVSKEETRYYLNGVYIHDVGGKLVTVATDGHRLYKQETDLPDGAENLSGAILPSGFVELVEKLFKGKACPATVRVEFSQTKCRIAFDSVTITSNLIDGSFPDYNRVIPTGNSIRGRFNPDEFSQALDAVSVISSERGRAFRLIAEDGKATLSVINASEGSRADADIKCDLCKYGHSSPYIEIGFNATYFNGILAECGDILELDFEDAGSPTVIRGATEGWLAVLMPMRV